MKTIMEQIKALELKQDKHNQVIERMYIIERTQGEAQRDMKTLYNAVDEVKEDMGHLHTAIDEIKEKEIRLEGRIGQP